MFLLDTNVVSELRRPERADANVLAWAASHPATHFFLSVITLLELEIGVLRIERKDARQGFILRGWLEQHLIPRFETRMISIDSACSRDDCGHSKCPRL